MITARILSRFDTLGHIAQGTPLPTLSEGDALRAAVALRRAGFPIKTINGFAGLINLDGVRLQLHVDEVLRNYAAALNAFHNLVAHNDMLTAVEQEAEAFDQWFAAYKSGYANGLNQSAQQIGNTLNALVMAALHERGVSRHVRVEHRTEPHGAARRRHDDVAATSDHEKHPRQLAEGNEQAGGDAGGGSEALGG